MKKMPFIDYLVLLFLPMCIGLIWFMALGVALQASAITWEIVQDVSGATCSGALLLILWTSLLRKYTDGDR